MSSYGQLKSPFTGGEGSLIADKNSALPPHIRHHTQTETGTGREQIILQFGPSDVLTATEILPLPRLVAIPRMFLKRQR